MEHLPHASRLLLLNIFNKIRISGDFPSDWRNAIIIPIPKHGKDPTKPTNYRRIALTSCICKTMAGILSVTLFSVKVNSISQCLKPGVDCSLYVDDFQVYYISSNMTSDMSIIERQLQVCLNKLQQWTTDNGFHFSKTKTGCMHICQKRGLHLDPQLFLDKSPIPVVEETKFLGVIFDRKLSFIPILNMFKKRGLKALNILKIIGSTEWGADRKIMLRLYRSLVRSKLDYGCIVGYPAILALRAMKRQTLLPSLHWICLVPRLVYPVMILNIVSTNISFPLGKMTGMVLSRTRFILSSRYWEIGSPPTGGAGRMKLSCVVPASVIHM